MAFSFTIGTLTLCLLFSRLYPSERSLAVFLIPIVLSAYFGGLRAGLLSTVLSVVLADYFLVDPVRSLKVTNQNDVFRLIVLVLAGMITSVALEKLHRTKATALRELADRRRAEGRLAESERRYRSLFQNMLDGFAYCRMIYDSQGRANDFVWLEVNPAFAVATGLENVVGRRATEMIPGIREAHPELFETYGRVARSGRPERFEIEFKPLNSWFSVYVYSPEREHIIVLFQNITKNKQTELAIRQNEAELAAIYDNVPVAILLVDGDNRVCKVNRFVDGFLEGRSADLLGQRSGNVLSCLRSLDRPEGCGFGPKCKECALRCAVQETIATGRNQQNTEVRITLSPGGLARDFVLLLSTAKLVVGGKPRVLVTLHDVTDRHAAAAELQRQLNLMKCITDQSADPIFLTDVDGRVTFLNPEAEKVFGYTAPEMMGRALHDLIHHNYPDGREFPADQCRVLNTLVTGENLRKREDVFFRKDGSMIDVSISTGILEAGGARAGIVYMIHDLTEQKQAASARLRSQKLEALGTMAGGIAHDFNNILAAINGNASLANSELQKGHSVRVCLSEISKASNRAAQLVRQILTFGRPVEQKREIQPLQNVVQEALQLVRATFTSLIEIRTEFAADLFPVNMDSSQIHQVIVNLATNAAHAIGDRPGCIDVHISNQYLYPEDLSSAPELPEGRYVRLQFSDNGCGMTVAVRDRMFDPFFTTKPVGLGTGLGLAVVQGIITNHRGAIAVYSEHGKGTAFRIYLPAVQKAAELAQAAPPEVPVTAGKRVLFVDDDEPLVYLYVRKLTRLGFEVRGLSDPQAALQEFRSAPHAFDVVITDVSMPHMSGFDLARELLGVRADIPIVVTSGYVRPEDQVKGDQLGIRDVIPKPWAEGELIGALNRALARGAADAKPASA